MQLNCFYCSKSAEYRKEIGNEDNPYQAPVCFFHTLNPKKLRMLNEYISVLAEVIDGIKHGNQAVEN